MKKLLVVPVMLAALALGTGTANATEGEYVESPQHSAPFMYPLEPGPSGTHDPCDRASFCPDGPPAESDANDRCLTDPTGCVPAEDGSLVYADTFYPAPPVTVPVEPVPAPVVEPVAETVPAPVEVQQAPAPEGTAERVAAGEELAYTGVEDAALAGLAASVLSGGVALVWLARRMRAE